MVYNGGRPPSTERCKRVALASAVRLTLPLTYMKTKIKKCKFCLGEGHTAFQCSKKPRKTLRSSRTGFKSKTVNHTVSGLKPVRKPQNSLQSLKSEADRVLSRYIRKKYADHRGLVECVTCGIYGDWRSMDSGHFISRRYSALRYDERNVHPQCIFCNRNKHGNLKMYRQFVVERYGPEILDYYRVKCMTPQKLTKPYLSSLILKYK